MQKLLAGVSVIYLVTLGTFGIDRYYKRTQEKPQYYYDVDHAVDYYHAFHGQKITHDFHHEGRLQIWRACTWYESSCVMLQANL